MADGNLIFEKPQAPVPRVISDEQRGPQFLGGSDEGIDFEHILELSRLAVARVRKNAACSQHHVENLKRRGETERRLGELNRWPESSVFTEREKAALALSESFSLHHSEKIAEDILKKARGHFDISEMVRLTLAVTAVNDWINLHAEAIKKVLVVEDTPIMNYFATELLRVSYLWAAVWAFLAIVVLITLHFQNFKFLLLTLTPLILAVLWRTGAMVWLGIDFNPANIVTLPLIIGIDVAFGVYIVDRYREDGKFGLFSGSTGKAIIMSALTSFFGFSSLLISHFRGMYSIGQLMSLGIAIGLVTAVFILPQILILLKPAPRAE